MKSNQFGRYFEDFKIGDIYHHSIRKTITESDNNLFCLLTMNHHPLHLDNEFASKSQHGRILVVGTYTLSVIVGITVQDISGKAIANLGYTVNHDGPVFVGDTIHAETEILDKRESRSKKDRGIVSVETKAFNQNDEKILTLTRNILIPKER